MTYQRLLEKIEEYNLKNYVPTYLIPFTKQEKKIETTGIHTATFQYIPTIIAYFNAIHGIIIKPEDAITIAINALPKPNKETFGINEFSYFKSANVNNQHYSVCVTPSAKLKIKKKAKLYNLQEAVVIHFAVMLLYSEIAKQETPISK